MDGCLGVFNCFHLCTDPSPYYNRAVYKWHRQFEAPRGMPKADDRLTQAPRGVRDPKKCRRHLWTAPNPLRQKCYKLNQNNLILFWGWNVPSDNDLWSKRNHEMMRSLWHLWSSKDGFTESVENKSAGVLSVRANISTLKYQHTTALATTACMLHYLQTNWQIHETWVHRLYHHYFAESIIILILYSVWVIME